MKIAKFCLFIASLAYPFTIVFAPDFTHIIVAILAMLWGLKFCGSGVKFDGLMSAFFAMALFINDAKYLYPTIVSLSLMIVFCLSLKTTPVITGFALAQKGELDTRGYAYTRRLTKIWICFFGANGALAYILSLLDDKSAWAIYSGALSYALIGALIGGEILYRRYVLKL